MLTAVCAPNMRRAQATMQFMSSKGMRKKSADFKMPSAFLYILDRGAALRLSALLTVLTMLGGCTLIPGAGPLKGQVSQQELEDVVPFSLVDITAETVRILQGSDGVGVMEALASNGPRPELTVGPGDQLAISIWEAGAQSLFSASEASGAESSGARAAQLPSQTVNDSGSIRVPYAGRIEVSGLTLEQIESKVQRALGGKAASPQVIVTLVKSVNGSVTVMGSVGSSGTVPLSPAQEKILDILAQAGGVPIPAYDAQISLTRRGSTVVIPLSRILSRPEENVLIHPGDIISVSRKPRTFTAFGATGRNARIPFNGDELNLVEAVAMAGGLLDLRANPRGVFLMRREAAAIAEPITGGKIKSSAGADLNPAIVYRLDLSRVENYFLGRDFAVEDGDVLYVANAATTSIQKIFQLFGLLTQPVIQGVVLDKAVSN